VGCELAFKLLLAADANPGSVLNAIQHQGWLKRTIEIELIDRGVRIDYSGRTFSFGSACIDGVPLTAGRSRFWFTPKFEAFLDGNHYEIEIRVWPWLAVRSLSVSVDEKRVFLEGDEHYKVTRYSDIIYLLGFCYFYIAPAILLAWFYYLGVF